MANLLDSRTRITRETHPVLPLVRTYCVNCGKPKGWVSTESYDSIEALQIIIICDDCDQTYGKLDLPEVPIEELKEK